MPRPPVPPIVRQPIHGRQGPFRGVRDTLEPTASHPRLALRMRNCLPLAPEQGSVVSGRPGFKAAGAPAAGLVQWMGQFTKTDGTELTVRIAGGQIEVYDWSADEWRVRVSREDLDNAGIALSTTAMVAALNFADKLVISDGLTQPCAWDGTEHGGLELLNNAPVFFGPATLYYGRIFAIKALERGAMVWCEPGQPNVGYEAGGFNNAWTIRQTAQDPLYALQGTNFGLYYFRARSIDVVMGAVDSEFRTSGTHAGVSSSVGTISPFTVILAGDRGQEHSIWFLDSDGQPQRLVIGAGLQDPAPWLDCRSTIAGQDLAYLPRAQAVYRPDLRVVLFLVAKPGSRILDRFLVFHESGQFMGVWDFPRPPVRIGMVKDASTLPRDQQAGAGSVTQADAVRSHPGDCDSSAPIQVRLTYSTQDAQPGDTVTIDQAVSGSGYIPMVVQLPTGAGRQYVLSIPGREYNPAGTPEQRRYRVRLLGPDGTLKGSMETGVVDTTYLVCGAEPPPGGNPAITNAQAVRTSAGDCGSSAPMRVGVFYSTSGTEPGDTVAVDVSVNGGAFVQFASGLPAGGGSAEDVLEGRQYDPAGIQEQRRYRVRLLRGGQLLSEVVTSPIDTSYTPCGGVPAPELTGANAVRSFAGDCGRKGGDLIIPPLPMIVDVGYGTAGAEGHSVAIDESINGGPFAEVASGLPVGAALSATFHLPGRVYDPAGTPESRSYRVRLVAPGGATVDELDAGTVDTSHITCPSAASIDVSRDDGECDLVLERSLPLKVTVSWTVSGIFSGDLVAVERSINGGPFELLTTATGSGSFVDTIEGAYYHPSGVPENRTYRVRVVRAGVTVSEAISPAVDTTAIACPIAE